MAAKETKLLEDIFLQPWYLPLKTATTIRRILPSEQRHKMKFYFEDYGCMKCSRKKVLYGANGMCRKCHGQLKLRILFAIKRRWTAKSIDNKPRTFTRIGDAQRILSDLVGQTKSSN